MVNNTKYGLGSLNNNSGTNNTAIGAYTLYNNSDTTNNTAIGSNSAFYTTTGSNNTSLGAGSLCNNTTGALNTAIGSSALEGPLPIGSVGNQNTAIGAQALYTNQGDLNTSLGAYSALGLTGGSYNTFLGANTSATQPNFNYSTAIGYSATVDDSNQIMMGGTASGSYPNIIIPGKAFLPNFTTLSIQNDQIVPKSYVDTVAAGLTPTQTCFCATTGDINLDLTTAPASSNTDGINFDSLPDGSYNVLVVSQGSVTPSLTSNIQNGVYILSKTPGPTYTWSRPVAPDPMSIGYDAVGAFSFVQGGTIYGKTGLIQIYKNTSNNLAIVGTDNLQYQPFFELNVSAGRGLDTQIINQKLYLNVDTSLNFINFLDSNTSSDPSANGTLALGTYTNNRIVIGPTGTSVPIQAQSIIQAQKGITGTTGSFSNLSASQQISAPAGITGTTGSFTNLSANGNIVQLNSESYNIVQSPIITNSNPNSLRATNMYGDLSLQRPSGANGGALRLYAVDSSNTNLSTQLYQGGSAFAFKNLAPGGPIGITLQDNSNNELDPLYLSQSHNQVRVGINTKNPVCTLDVNGITSITSASSSLGTNTFSINDKGSTGGTKGIFFYPNATQGTLNPLQQNGDNWIVGFSGFGRDTANLTINTWATQKNGIRITPLSTSIHGGNNSFIIVDGSVNTTTIIGTNVGINTTSPNYTLDVSGTMHSSGLISAPGGITGTTGSFSYLSASQQIIAPAGITGTTGSFSYLNASQKIIAPAGITGSSSSFESIIVSGNTTFGSLPTCTATPSDDNQLITKVYADQTYTTSGNVLGSDNTWKGNNTFNKTISAPAGITGTTGSFSYLTASQQIIAPAGITGTTGSFSYLNTSQQIIAPAGITGTTGSFSYLTASQQIIAPAGITGTTGSFTYLTASQIISSSRGITGTTGSFSYLTASQQISAPAGITGTTGSFTNLTASQQIIAPAGITGTTGSFTYLTASQIISSSRGITGTTGSFSYLTASQQISAPAGITGTTGSFSYLNANFGSINVAGAQFSSSGNDATISLNNTSSDGHNWWLGSGNKSSGSVDNFYIYDYTSNNTRLVINNSSGNIGIGNTNPQSTLDVSGNGNFTGSVTASSFNATSDYRIKENVISLDDKFIVDKLIPVTYKNKLTDKQDIGLIAHEVQEIYPFLVNGEKDGENFQSVNYTGLIALLIKEIKELKQRVKVLEENN
jgi:hypothetical protein